MTRRSRSDVQSLKLVAQSSMLNVERGTWNVLFGVFGDPVSHSLSPVMHNTALKELGLACRYGKFHVPKEDLALALAGAAILGMRGINLTIPLKEAALGLMDRVTPAARRAQAVNTVSFHDGGMEGHNTDGEGFLLSLKDEWGYSPRGACAVLLGAGGAGRAVAFALMAAGVRRIVVVNRTFMRAVSLARVAAAARTGGSSSLACVMARRFPSASSSSAIGEWRGILAGADLLVNATSIGMRGEPSQVPAVALARPLRVVDLVYTPPETDLVRLARQRGLRVMNGAGMLVHQGALSLERWTGRSVPVGTMRRALMRALRERRSR